MIRTTNSPATKHRRKKILKAAKGFSMRRRRTLKCAMEAVRHAKEDKTVSRKLLKRNNRRLWIMRLNDFSRENGMKYSILLDHIKNISGLSILRDRKILSKIVFFYPEIAKNMLTKDYYSECIINS